MSLGRAGTLSCFVSFVVKGHLSHYYSMHEHMCTYVTKISAFLCTGAESNPRNRVWVEQKRIALLFCRQRETHQASVSKKTMCLNPSEVDKGLQQWVKGGVSDKIRV